VAQVAQLNCESTQHMDRIHELEIDNICHQSHVDLLRAELHNDQVTLARMRREREVIDLTDDEEVEVVIPGLEAVHTLVPIEEPAPVPVALPALGEVSFLSVVCQVADVILAYSGQRAVRSHQGMNDGRRNLWRRVVLSQEEEFRDFQAEVDFQGREPYQNADRVADRLVEQGLALPTYVDPLPYDGPPSYDDYSWISCRYHSAYESL